MRKFLAVAGFALTLPFAALAQTTAIVIGVDEYPFLNSLSGAVNDAKDVAGALQKSGVQRLQLFLNADARKDAITAAWQQAVTESVAGDTIIFTYAGHGAQMPELVAGSEEDGKDEFLVLPGFDVKRRQETFHEIIVDNELNAWFKEADAKGIQVLFVLDSCHSGGMSRSVNGKTRLAPAVTVKLTPPSEDAVSGAGIKEDSFRWVTVLAASLESQPTPEVIIDNVPRGALSWSFARSLEGKADRNDDGVLTRIELEDYVFSNVKAWAEALQVPNFTPAVARSDREVVVDLKRSTGAAESGQQAASGTIREEGWVPELSLAVEGSDFRPENIKEGGAAPFRWDAASGTFYTPNGEVAGEHIRDAKLQLVVDKFILLDFLKRMSERNPGTASLTPVKDIYAAGDRLRFDAPSPGYKNMLVFNLANTGDVQLLDVQSDGKPAKEFKLSQLQVVEPFGADHLIVISTNEPIDAIAAVMNRQGVTTSELLKILPERLDGTDTQVSVQPLYTREAL